MKKLFLSILFLWFFYGFSQIPDTTEAFRLFREGYQIARRSGVTPNYKETREAMGKSMNAFQPLLNQTEGLLDSMIWSRYVQSKMDYGHFHIFFDQQDIYLNLMIDLEKEVKRKYGEDCPWLRNIYLRKGIALGRLGRDYENLAAMQESIDLAKRLSENPNISTELHNIAISWFSLGHFDQALASSEESLRYAPVNSETLGALSTVCNFYHSFGQIRMALGEYETARDYFEKALSYGFRMGFGEYTKYMGNAYKGLALYYQMIGDFHQARIYYEKVATIFEKVRTPNDIHNSTLFSEQGDNAMAFGDHMLAESYYLKALHVNINALGSYHGGVYPNYLSLANSSLASEKPLQALSYLENAQAVIDSNYNESHPSMVSIAQEWTKTYLQLEDFPAAKKHLEQGLLVAKEVYPEKHPEIVDLYLSKGKLAIQLENEMGALEAYQQALIANLKGFNETDILVLPDKEMIPINDQKYLSSLQAKAQAFYHFRAHNPKYLEAAANCYQLAAIQIDRMRKSFRTETSKLNLQEASFSVFLEAIDLAFQLYEETGNTYYKEQIFIWAENSRAMLLHEASKQAEARQLGGLPPELKTYRHQLRRDLSWLEKNIFEQESKGEEADTVLLERSQNLYFKYKKSYDSLEQVIEKKYPDYYALKYAETKPNLQSVQRQLKGEDRLIEYFWGDSLLYILSIGKKEIKILRKPIKDFESQLDSFLVVIGKPSIETATFGRLSQQLSETLLPGLPDEGKLIFIPDNKLAFLPFELLLTTSSNIRNDFRALPFLLKSHPMHYEFAASFITKKRKKPKAQQLYAGFAPIYNGKALYASRGRDSVSLRSIYRGLTEELPNLEHAQQEIEVGSQLFRGSSFLGKSATEKAFIENASQYRILHLAMHGLLNDQAPEYSGLVFSEPEPQPILSDSSQNKMLIAQENALPEDGFLTVAELYNLSLNSELAILSACETGLGKVSKGEGILSMGRAFKYAGCPSILMSLWQVDDASSQQLVNAFLENLHAGMDKAEALRQAKLAFLEKAESDKVAPYFWAPMVLIGDDAPLGGDDFSITYGWIIALIVLLGIGGFLRFRRR